MNAKRKWSLFDIFLAFLVLLAGLAVYFSFFRPLQFSHLIKREGVNRYASVTVLLPDDLGWMAETVPVGEELRNAYGHLDWKILAFGEAGFQGKKSATLEAKLQIVEDSSGLLRYGKYTLVKGGKIYLINDNFFIEGRILDYRALDERVLI